MIDSVKATRIKEYLIITAIFIILTAILTYPMIFHLSDTIGGGDEAFTCWSLAWATHSCIENPLNFFNANIFYPANAYSFALSEHLIGWVPFSIPVYILTQDPVFTHNLLKLLTFVLCGLGAYLLSYYYTRNRYAALIAGICFAFFSYRLTIQLHLLAMEWVPFVILYLDRFLHSPRWKEMIIGTFFFLLSVLSGWYIAIFTCMIVGIYTLGYLILDESVRRRVCNREVGKMALLSLVIIVLVLLPLAIPYFHASSLYDAERGLSDPAKSSWAIDPGIVLSYFSLISLLLACIGLIWTPRRADPTHPERKFGSEATSFLVRQKIPILYGIIVALSYILMIGPIVKIGSFETGLLGPYYYIYKIFPFVAIVRDLSRFSFVMSFAVSMLAGFGVAALASRVQTEKRRTLLSLLLILLVIAGSWHVPVSMPTSLATGDKIPGEYTWLAKQTDNPIIIEIPTRWVEDNSEYTYYSVYHWKEMVNGYSGRDSEEASKIMRDTSEFFPSNTTIALLQKIGVKYVFVHADRLRKMFGIADNQADEFESAYLQGMNAEIAKNYSSSVRLAESFGPTNIYEIGRSEVEPDEVVLILQSGWYGSNVDNTHPFYLKKTGSIKVLAQDEGNYTIRFLAEPISADNHLTLQVNSVDSGTVTMPGGRVSQFEKSVHLQKGFNELQFSSNGCTKLCDIPGTNTILDECLSYGLSNLTITHT